MITYQNNNQSVTYDITATEDYDISTNKILQFHRRQNNKIIYFELLNGIKYTVSLQTSSRFCYVYSFLITPLVEYIQSSNDHGAQNHYILVKLIISEESNREGYK